MPNARLNLSEMFRAKGIRQQILAAARQLGEVLGGREQDFGYAYEICHTWQRRFESAIRSEIPEWVGLAGFRIICDFYLPPDKVENIFPPRPKKIETDDCPKNIETLEQIWQAYVQYFDEGRDLHSGKFQLKGEAEKHFLDKLGELEPMLGGQAGNILWLWHLIGANAIAYVPYISKELTKLPERFPVLKDLPFLRFEDESYELTDLDRIVPGVLRKSGSRTGAPSGGSVVMVRNGRRLIFMFDGMRHLGMKEGDPMPWDQVRFKAKGKDLHDKPLSRSPEDITWPAIPVFAELEIDEAKRELVIRAVDRDRLEQALKGRVDYAVLGGINAILGDPWLKRDLKLQTRLFAVVEEQLRTLTRCGVRIGMELSGIPEREYALFIRRLCQEGVIVCLGINGVDELPHTVGDKLLKETQLYDFWLDPETLPKKVRAEAGNPSAVGDHFEYITYRQARKMAEATGVRTFYAHTMALDFILRKDADPGALLRAQQGDMMGKGLVIAALLVRQFGDQWLDHLRERMPPAVKPDAMVRLARFAEDFERFEDLAGAKDRLLRSGYWLASGPGEYSVGVVPVMWPHVSEHGHEEVSELVKSLNTTGSGDKTLGAFHLLGGV